MHVQVKNEDNLLDIDIMEKDELSSHDDLTYSHDFLGGPVLHNRLRSSNQSPSASLPNQKVAKPISTRDYLLSGRSGEEMRKEQAQQIYAVSNAKKKIKFHH